MRCPNCDSLDTKRKGKTQAAPTALAGPLKPLQRFVCRCCESSFTQPRKRTSSRTKFADDVVNEAVRTYVQGLCSYRLLATMLEQRFAVAVSRFTLNRWVLELGAQAKAPLEVSRELAPRWGGFLGIDGKAINVRGEQHCLLIGVGHATQDLVHALVLDAESAEGFARLETEARLDAGYPLKGIVSDLGPGFARVHRDHFGKIPFQACRVHFDRRLDQEIPKSSLSGKAPLYAELKERIRRILYAESYEQACKLLAELRAHRARFKRIRYSSALGSVQRNFALYTAHHFTPGLPADNNVTENVIKQLNKKLRLMEGFGSVDAAERYVRLLVGCYRFKRFTDSSRTTNNGRAPLELAGVDLSDRDWLSFLLSR